MNRLKANLTMSLDGLVAGPEQSEQDPLGLGGLQLPESLLPLQASRDTHGAHGGEVNATTPFVEEILAGADS
jgi:hypothetical protein